jgi:hypothetical protein
MAVGLPAQRLIATSGTKLAGVLLVAFGLVAARNTGLAAASPATTDPKVLARLAANETNIIGSRVGLGVGLIVRFPQEGSFENDFVPILGDKRVD